MGETLNYPEIPPLYDLMLDPAAVLLRRFE
jgi:hypothetical protein